MSGGMKITGGGHPEAGGIVRIIQEHPVESAITGLSLGALACGMQGLVTPTLAPTEAPVNPGEAPMRLIRIDESKAPADIKAKVESKYGQDVADYYTFSAESKSIPGYDLVTDTQNAANISFDLYSMSDGKMIGSFADASGKAQIGEVKASTFVQDGILFQTLTFDHETSNNGQNQTETLYFFVKNFGSIDGYNPQMSDQELSQIVAKKIAEGKLTQVGLSNPLMAKPNSILWNGNADQQNNPFPSLFESVLNFGVTEVHALGEEGEAPVVGTATPNPNENQGQSSESTVKVSVGQAEVEVRTGSVKGVDHKTGTQSDWTVEATSVKNTIYGNDAVFPDGLVTGEATDANGQKFAVIWNEEGNYWFKNENIDFNLMSPNRTNFGKQLKDMVESRDMYRMLLTQIDTSFPADTQTARFWMVPRSSATARDFYYYLDMSRADNSDDGVPQLNATGEDLPTYQDIRYGGFAKGKEPYRYLAMIDGVSPDWTDRQNNHIDGKKISIIPVLVQNTDGKSMIWFAGMDATQRDDILTGNYTVDGDNVIIGNTAIPKDQFAGYLSAKENSGIQTKLIDKVMRMALVIPPANEADWDNHEKDGDNNGGVHFGGTLNYSDDAIIAMQDKPGVFYNLLPKDMQQKLDRDLNEVKVNGWQIFHAVPFEGNAIPQNVIDYLSNHIFETYYDSNPSAQ